MSVMMVGSVIGDSATYDETLHITAGYSYLLGHGIRWNPEHPPLVKDLGALIPYFFLHPNFPPSMVAGSEHAVRPLPVVSGEFLYGSGNDADAIVLAARIPMIALALGFGWLIFVWMRRRHGSPAALLTLYFFVCSPTLLAHARYVTTDMAAGLAFFIGIASFLWFLDGPSWFRAVGAGTALGVALLLKFSTVFLLPLDALYAALFVSAGRWISLRGHGRLERLGRVARALLSILPCCVLMILVALAVIWIVYAVHIHSYDSLLGPLGEYSFGYKMVVKHLRGGHTGYLLGKLSAVGWWYYFPVIFLLKETLPFLILMLAAFLIAVHSVWRTSNWSFESTLEWIRAHSSITAMVLFVAAYWLVSLQSHVNIGIRHILPTLPFLYMLVALGIVHAVSQMDLFSHSGMGRWLGGPSIRRSSRLAAIALGGVLLWLAIEAAAAYPYYLSYFNELAGGSANGYRFAVDSNYDWGQDIKRLAKFADANRIQKMGVDCLECFSGPEYYLGQRFVPWSSARGAPDIRQGDPEWIAVSVNNLAFALAARTSEAMPKPEDSYTWLRGVEPFGRGGTSFFVFHFPK